MVGFSWKTRCLDDDGAAILCFKKVFRKILNKGRIYWQKVMNDYKTLKGHILEI